VARSDRRDAGTTPAARAGDPMSIEVANESGVVVEETMLVRVARHALDSLGVSPLAELSILLVDVDAMERLHVRWMGEPGPTDVLAFPMDELDLRGSRGVGHGAHHSTDEPDDVGPAVLGDVVLCPVVAERQAAAAGHSTEDELELLCTHGVLHLLGYDHAEPEEHAEMFGLQATLLASWQEARSR
jgi:probable rRNA maturation factor